MICGYWEAILLVYSLQNFMHNCFKIDFEYKRKWIKWTTLFENHCLSILILKLLQKEQAKTNEIVQTGMHIHMGWDCLTLV
jgi:metal-responsive CopG/Arc/MetJ family transcriptional regulator